MPLRADFNYEFNRTDADIDHEARTRGHGHVTPHADGLYAKCRGVRGGCGVCCREAEIAEWDTRPKQARIPDQLAALRTTVEYQAIAEHYEGLYAARSGVAWIEHINQGLAVLLDLDAPVEALLAYCLHPLCQADADLAQFDPNAASGSATVVMLAMEYRNVANRYLSEHHKDPERFPRLSPLATVNLMLVADKVQNRKDFEVHHAQTHPDRDRLADYFTTWLDALGVDEAEYQRLAAVCRSVEPLFAA